MSTNAPTAAAPSAEPPKTFWGKLLASTPIAMTVVATLLAGLSSAR